jgi:hypothetical protein
VIALGASLLAMYLGASSIRFWWHGLAFLATGALALGALATVARISDPFVSSAAGFRIEPGWIAAGLALMFGQMLFCYGVAAGVRYLVLRIARRNRSRPPGM